MITICYDDSLAMTAFEIKMGRYLISVLVVCCVGLAAIGQPPQEDDLRAIIARAAEESANYQQTFRNLIADEKRIFETFRENGSIKRRRTVESNFIVYQLSTDDKRIVEYRHITGVDGRKFEKADHRAQEFFERLAKAGTSSEELDRIRKESFRHDEIEIEGYTLFQGVPLAESLKGVIEFKILGVEQEDGGEVILIRYQQTRSSPYVRVSRAGDKETNASLVDIDIEEPSKEPMNARLRGNLWLDRSTLKIRQEIRELTIQPAGFEQPLVISRTEFHYRGSDFGILTPSKIRTELYKPHLKRKTASLDIRAVMEYSRFTNPDVEVRSAEVKN